MKYHKGDRTQSDRQASERMERFRVGEEPFNLGDPLKDFDFYCLSCGMPRDGLRDSWQAKERGLSWCDGPGSFHPLVSAFRGWGHDWPGHAAAQVARYELASNEIDLCDPCADYRRERRQVLVPYSKRDRQVMFIRKALADIEFKEARGFEPLPDFSEYSRAELESALRQVLRGRVGEA